MILAIYLCLLLGQAESASREARSNPYYEPARP